MEPDASPRPAAPPPAEWRALSRLRERVEDAVREVERLRAQNAALARRVAELQEGLGGDEPAGGVALPGATDPEALRAKIQGFIDAIDEVLAAPEPDAGPDGDGASAADLFTPDGPPPAGGAAPAP